MALVAAVLLMAASVTGTPSSSTDFGVRDVGGGARLPKVTAWQGAAPRVDIAAAAGVGAQWGRVTSTYRSPEHNRRVGGVHNSFHLQGRAIDIARKAGASHAAIAAAFRNAGYQLIESLDEGDHSHFAFGSGTGRIARGFAQQSALKPIASATQWRIVAAPR